jgi:uncharacterized protein DUF4129
VNGARRLLLSGIALTALLALVALASRAHRPGGSSGGGRGHVPALLLEYVGVMGLIAVLVGGAVMAWAAADMRRKKALAAQTSWRRVLTGLAAGAIVLFVLVALTRHLTQPSAQGPRGPTGLAAPLRAANAQRAKLQRDAPQQGTDRDWLTALVLGSVLLGLTFAVTAAVGHRRRHREEIDEEVALARALDEVLADTLDDLRAERDPRKAVIGAYARMERAFAAYRVPRDPAETPLEYVSRALDSLSVRPVAVRRLTLLFERSKFSTHAVDTRMKDEAIETLAALRAELELGQKAAA